MCAHSRPGRADGGRCHRCDLAGPAAAALAAAARPGGACNAVAGAYQFPGADGVTPAAWTGDGLTVPACGPIPNDGGPTTPVAPYPGALKTPGYQCVEFSERYLFYRYGVTMDIPDRRRPGGRALRG